jgi:hypothetical protein
MSKKKFFITKADKSDGKKIYLIQWHINDYKAAIILQNHLVTRIVQQPYLSLIIKNKIVDFPIFSFFYNDDEYFLLSNYVDNKYLHQDFKGIDFFIIPNNDIDDDSWNEFYYILKNVNSISGIYVGNEKTVDFINQVKDQMQLNKISV